MALVPSRIPGVDYVINPYIGCGFGCKFCYANYMARAVGRRPEEWGSFVVPKSHLLSALVRQLRKPWHFYGKYILIGSATDPYQPLEARVGLTREVLRIILKLAPNLRVGILTRSSLVLRDVPLLRQLKADVGISVSVLRDEYFREVEPKSPPLRVRLNVLKMLKEAGLEPYVFLAPIFPDTLDILGDVLEEIKALRVQVRYAELLSPFKNPNLRTLRAFPRWVRLIREGGLYAKFYGILRAHYPEVEVIRHGWA